MRDVTNIEIEACTCDKTINLHLEQGYMGDDGNAKYTLFMNTDFNEQKCEDLINALKNALTDLKAINSSRITKSRSS